MTARSWNSEIAKNEIMRLIKPGVLGFYTHFEATLCTCFLPAELMSTEEEDNPDVEIQLIFRRKIAGLRRLPRHQRAQALRAALEWLWSTLAGIAFKSPLKTRANIQKLTTTRRAWWVAASDRTTQISATTLD